MRTFSIFLLFIISSPVLHAGNSVDFISALSELNDTASDWQFLLQKARSNSFDKVASEDECVFFDSPKIAAPDWVCDMPVEGVDVTAVGTGRNEVPSEIVEKISEERGDYVNRIDAPIKAYMNALIAAKSEFNVSSSVTRDKATEKMKDRVTKQTMAMSSLSGDVRLTQMIKHFVEYDENGEEGDSVSSSATKLVYKTDDCKALITQFTEISTNQEPGVAEKMVSRGACDFYKIADDMSASGWKLLDMLQSPDNTYYALVGYIAPVDDQYSEAALNNDKKLWEQFKKGTGIE